MLLEERHKLNTTMNLAFHNLNSGDGCEGLCMFYKIKTLKLPEYLYYLILNDRRTYDAQNLDYVETYFSGTDAFKYSFFPNPFLNGTNFIQTCALLNHIQRSQNWY